MKNPSVKILKDATVELKEIIANSNAAIKEAEGLLEGEARIIVGGLGKDMASTLEDLIKSSKVCLTPFKETVMYHGNLLPKPVSVADLELKLNSIYEGFKVKVGKFSESRKLNSIIRKTSMSSDDVSIAVEMNVSGVGITIERSVDISEQVEAINNAAYQLELANALLHIGKL